MQRRQDEDTFGKILLRDRRAKAIRVKPYGKKEVIRRHDHNAKLPSANVRARRRIVRTCVHVSMYLCVYVRVGGVVNGFRVYVHTTSQHLEHRPLGIDGWMDGGNGEKRPRAALTRRRQVSTPAVSERGFNASRGILPRSLARPRNSSALRRDRKLGESDPHRPD